MTDEDSPWPLGPADDLAGMAGLEQCLPPRPHAQKGAAISRALRRVLGVPRTPSAVSVEVVEGWSADGVDGTLLRWSSGFGVATDGWLLRPAGEHRPLPGVVALHCHGGRRWFGKEKIADGDTPPHASVAAFRTECYCGRPIANDLARAGYAVLVHDAFSWGSKRLTVSQMSTKARRIAALEVAARRSCRLDLDEVSVYDIYAAANEDSIAKTFGLLGTSWGGVIASEDLLAARVLRAQPGTRSGGVSMVGFSGGGARAVIAGALSPDVRAVGVVAMMSTFSANLHGYVQTHSWTLHNPGIARVAEWPEIAASRAPRPLFVGYAAQDPLFSLRGMQEADATIGRLYSEAGAGEAYVADWADAPHAFPFEMQRRMAAWLQDVT